MQKRQINDSIKAEAGEDVNLKRKSNSLSLQSFVSLVNLLSSSHSVWELLGQKPLANRTGYTLREVPSSMPVSGFSHLAFQTVCSARFGHLRACLHLLSCFSSTV